MVTPVASAAWGVEGCEHGIDDDRRCFLGERSSFGHCRIDLLDG